MPDSRTAAPAVTTVRLVYLARLREAFGRSDEDIAMRTGALTVAALLDLLRARGGVWADELAPGRAVRVAVNHAVVGAAESVLRNGDEVALLPPVTGG